LFDKAVGSATGSVIGSVVGSTEGSAAGLKCLTRGKSSFKVGEGGAADSRKRLLFIRFKLEKEHLHINI